MICGNWAFEAIPCNKNQNKYEHEYFRRVCSWSYVQFFKNPNILLIFLKKKYTPSSKFKWLYRWFMNDLLQLCAKAVSVHFFFLYILHAVQNQTKIFIKITFKKLIHNLFLLHYIYLDTILLYIQMYVLCIIKCGFYVKFGSHIRQLWKYRGFVRIFLTI